MLWSLAAAVAMVGAVFLVGDRLHRQRILREKARRAGEELRDFAASFGEEAVPDACLEEVYRFFQAWVGDADFPVRRTDSLARLYGIVDDDVDRMRETLARRTGQAPPAEWRSEAPRTVGDVALLLSPRGSPARSGRTG